MKTRSFLLFVALSSLFAACNPVIHGGGTGGAGAEGGAGGSTCDGYMGGNGGTGGGTVTVTVTGTGGGTGGGTYDPCAGLSCGDTCSLCGPADTCLPAETFCDAAGQCQAGPPVCDPPPPPPPSCNTDADCAVPQNCALCPDGTSSCPVATCVDGQCVISEPACAPPPPPTPCNTDADCLTPAQPEVCEVCSDGSDVCAENVCVSGQCQAVFPACPGN